MEKRSVRKILWIVVTCTVIWAVAGLVPSPLRAYVPGERQLFYPIFREVYYFGDAYQCNICRRSFRKFRKSPDTGNELQCPFCGSRPRHRTFLTYFKERTDLFDGKPKRMLHVAPEAFLTPIFRAERNIGYLSGDLDPGNPEIGGAMVQMDITDIHYPDNSFDVIYCSHVLEHVPDDRKAMRELARVLKPGGWALIAVPILLAPGRTVFRDRTFEDPKVTTPAERERAYGQWDHLRAYGLVDFPDRLRESGFDVTVDAFPHSLSEEMVRKQGLSREDIYLCRKHQTSLQ
jgi:SAM-dependent methyltransferase